MTEPSAVTIRRAGADDADALAAIGAATFLESFAGVLPGADIVTHCARAHAVERYRAYLADDQSACWLAGVEPGGAPIGYAAATAPDLPLPDLSPDDWELKRIYLFSRFQGSGAGWALMRAVLDEARRRGRRRLLLGVYGRNDKAIAFYRRCGFRVAGERRFTVGASTFDDLIFARATEIA